ncbi:MULTISPECIES: DinB family protein [Brucella/Ochrobactrum group]|uniref:DinB family protein n=1 Tax=Brucella/Ochrobactrum group TaxID=2826938 RepID=UPI001123769B|nr:MULTISPECIES: DinB family protein [Brucella/Ochrobactrum group]
MEQHFQMFSCYNRWANELLYAAAANLSDEEYRLDLGLFFGSIHRTLNHLLVTDRIWMKRFTGEGDHPKQLDAIITDNFITLRDLRNAEDERICRYTESLNADQLAGRFTYTTISDMRTMSQRLAPSLAHLFNHQTHHRGQIHAALTRLGTDAPSLDLSQFQRSEGGRRFA